MLLKRANWRKLICLLLMWSIRKTLLTIIGRMWSCEQIIAYFSVKCGHLDVTYQNVSKYYVCPSALHSWLKVRILSNRVTHTLLPTDNAMCSHLLLAAERDGYPKAPHKSTTICVSEMYNYPIVHFCVENPTKQYSNEECRLLWILHRVAFLSSVLRLLVTAKFIHSSPTLVTLMMGAISSFEVSILTKVTRHHIPQNGILHSHRREISNLI
jgi:hypothetical protein